MKTQHSSPRPHAMRASWPPHRTLWFWLLLGWTVSAADRALTGPVVTWMIGNHVGFLADTSKPVRPRRAHRRPVLRRLHAHPVARRLPRRPLRPPDARSRSASCGPASRRCSGRPHRARPLHRHPRAHRAGRGRVLLQRPQPDRGEDADRAAQPRHGRRHHRTGLRHHAGDGLRAEHDRARRQGLRGRRGLADAVLDRSAPRRCWSAPGSRCTSAARSAGSRTRARRCTSAPTRRSAWPRVMAVYFIGDAAGLSDIWIAVLEVGLAVALALRHLRAQGRRDRPGAALARPDARSTSRSSPCCGTCGSSRSGRSRSWPMRRIRRSGARRSSPRSTRARASSASRSAAGCPTSPCAAGSGASRWSSTFTALQCAADRRASGSSSPVASPRCG